MHPTPKAFNLDNLVQAGGAARGMNARRNKNYEVVQLLSELWRQEVWYPSTPSCANACKGLSTCKSFGLSSTTAFSDELIHRILPRIFMFEAPNWHLKLFHLSLVSSIFFVPTSYLRPPAKPCVNYYKVKDASTNGAGATIQRHSGTNARPPRSQWRSTRARILCR